METLCWWVAVFLAANIAVGVTRAFRGADPAAYLMAALLFGTTGVAVLLLLAEATGVPALRDVALVLVALAALAVVVFTTRTGTGRLAPPYQPPS